jgi:hypothetical protein
MNIIKLKDLLMPENSNMAEFFNKNLKGKYAYWVQMRYIFPLESLDYKTYIQYEQYDRIKMLGDDVLPHIDLYSEECCMHDFAQEYVDQDVTELINSTTNYTNANAYIADFDIDITKLRRFRSWLAEEILKLSTNMETGEYMSNLTDNQIHVLEYYKNNMYNDVIKHLNEFGYDNAFISNQQNTTCGCCNNSSNLYALSDHLVCNALDIYVKNLHNLMVITFEDVNFWLQFTKEFILLFKKYIDNIIKTGLIINRDEKSSLYTECICHSGKNDASNEILRNLSEALEYMINDEVSNHSNFIHDALYNWAEYLYDKMSWELK